ncbi:MAG: MarR family transcriptional regulator [Proteobacteria bacterium]|nr:MarR family transcriptional regulator [Pseudomonadota bacterium]
MKSINEDINLKEIEEFGDQLRNWRNFIAEFFNKVIKDSGKISGFDFSMSQFKTMGAFRENTVYTMGELSKNASVTMPTMTEMIDNLEREGIAERIRDSQDRRVVKVRLTEKGKQLRKKFMDKRRNELKNILSNLSKEDRGELMNALAKAYSVLKKNSTV